MPNLTLQNFTSLLENESAAVQGSSTAPINLDSGSVIRAILEADVSQALWLQYLVLLVLQASRLATSFGTDCDSFGADFGFERLLASPSSGSVTFSRFSTTIAAFVPLGTQAQTADGTQSFTVVADTTNPNYVASPLPGFNIPIGIPGVTVPVQSVNLGTQANVLANTITVILGGIAGVDSVSNAGATAGGVNAESDPAFKIRFVNFINSRAEGTDAAVAYAIQQVQQGLTYTIQENTTIAGAYTPGTFVVTVDDGSGNISSGLLGTITTAIQAIRPIGSTAVVVGAQEIVATVVLTVAVPTGTNGTTIINEVAAAIVNFITALGVGATMPFYQIANLAFNADASISNVSLVTLNGATVDVVPTKGQVVRTAVSNISVNVVFV